MRIVDIYEVYKNSKGVSTDTRTLLPGQIFVALKGENFDGHEYVDLAINKGAVKVIIDNPKYKNENTFLVKNTLKTLQNLARFHKDHLDIPVLGITGSNGKTTTKELINQVLSKKYKVHATKGNLNNHIGVPLTILSTPDDTEFLVVEMGANHIGEIAELCQIADPEYGLITNIGKAHLEGFGSYEGVIKAKTELYSHIISKEGILFVNTNDDLLRSQLDSYPNKLMYPSDITFEISELYLNFTHADKTYSSALYGEYNATNILAAITVGRKFGMKDEIIFEAISEYQPNMNRSQIKKIETATFILDAYNANPSSMELSINSLKQMQSNLPKFLVLGDMKELGEDVINLHRETLSTIKIFGHENIFLVGKMFEQADVQNEFIHFETVDKLVEYLRWNKYVFDNSIVLIKASRSMHLEKVSEYLSSQSES